MRLSSSYVACACVSSLLIYLTAATAGIECTLGEYPIEVSNQAEVNAAIPSNCTTLIGSISILPNYTGTLELNGLTNFTGTLLSRRLAPVPGLTTLAMENLMVMGYPDDGGEDSGIDLPYLPGLEFVNMPKLTWISALWISNFTRTIFDLSGLKSAFSIVISGESITDILFTSLVDVEDLSISSGPSNPLNISLPALQNASSVSISGSLSGLFVPELSGPDNTWYKHGGASVSIKNIDTSGSTIPVAFPKLQACSVIDLVGAIQSFSFPLVINTDGFYISASRPLSVNFTTLETVGTIALTNNISSFDFPALKSIKSLSIFSQLNINCTPALTAYNLHHSTNSAGTAAGEYSCLSTYRTYETPVAQLKPGLTLKSKLSLGLGFGLGGLAALCLGLCWWSYRKWSQKAKTIEEREHGIELENYPPGYLSDAATEVGSIRSERTAAPPFEGHERPPDYAERVDRPGRVDEGDVSPASTVGREGAAA